MTLERHQSKLIPAVDYAGDGRIFVTDVEGTFPLRGGGDKPRSQIPSFDRPSGMLPAADQQSFHSYDPRRDSARRKAGMYRPREPSRFAAEVNALGGTIGSSGSQSLQRKIKRLKRTSDGQFPLANGEPDSYWSDYKEPHDTKFNSLRTWSSIGKKKRQINQGDDQYTTTGSMRRIPKDRRRSLDLEQIKKYKKEMRDDRKSAMLEMYRKQNGGYPLIKTQRLKNKRLAEEKLPGILFIITGMFMLAVGTTRILLSWWHAYFCVIWAGLPILILGIFGVTHKGEYFTKWTNGSYIALGIFGSFASMAASAILLHLLVPIITFLIDDMTPHDVAGNVTFTNLYKSLAIQIPRDSMVWATLVLDSMAFLLCLVNFFAFTAGLVALGNHWDAVYKITGECDHRGHPTGFNPFEQMALGQTTLFVGLVVVTLWTSSYNHLYAPVYGCILIMVAGFVSLCYGKRPDKKSLGYLSATLQIVAILVLTATCVAVLLGALDDGEIIHRQGSINNLVYGQRMASLVAESFYIFLIFVNVIFVIGIMFRYCKNNCCRSCLDDSRPRKF